MCEDIEAFIATIRARGLSCTDANDMGWGILATLTLPGGGALSAYQPRHARPEPMSGGTAAKKPAAKKPAAKKK